MAKKQLVSIIEEKLVGTAVAIGIGGGIAYIIYNRFFKKTTDKANEKKELELINKELDPSKLSYPASNYYLMAQTIAVAGFDVGTDEEAIYNVFRQLKTNSDFLALRQAWGKKKIYDFGIPYVLTLAEFLHWEMSADEIKKINNILKSKGIKYTV